MPDPFSAVIFDLDGVLADSEPWWNKIDAKLLGEHGVNYRGEHHREVLGVSYRLAVEFYKNTFNISAPTEELMRRRGEIATEFFANRVGLFPNVRKVLEDLRGNNAVVGRLCQTPASVGVSQSGAAGTRATQTGGPKGEARGSERIKRPTNRLHLAVATSSVSASARPFLDRHRLTEFFDVIITGDEIERGKPHPDIYLRAAEKLGVAPNECLVIEDALSGVAAGKAAGMPVAAIPDTRFVDRHAYEDAANYVLGSLSEIPALVKSRSGRPGQD